MKRILIAGGGTGGHIFPGLAVAGALRDAEVLFVGSTRGLEKRIIPRAGYRLRTIHMMGINRSIHPRLLLLPFVVALGLVESLVAVLRFRPHLPAAWTSLTVPIRFRNRRLRMTVTRNEVQYQLLEGEDLAFKHMDEEFHIRRGEMIRVA